MTDMNEQILDNETLESIVNDTIDNGTIELVHIAPVGDFVGSDAEGNPVPENITAEALQDIANNLNSTGTEVLADIDHGAAKPGVSKDTSAAGWFTRFIVDPIKGLFANLKLTKKGKELLENREYRYISPTFTLDDTGKPVELHTASLTNMPAFKGYIDPILNQEAEPISNTDEGIDNMTKEELVALIKETVTSMKEEKLEEVKDKAETEETAVNGCSEDKETIKNEDVTETETVKETVEEPAVNGCSEETKDKVKNEVAEETKEEEEKKEEVIKMEALNSSPTALSDIKDSAWRNLHGKEFFDYLAKHPEIKG